MLANIIPKYALSQFETLGKNKKGIADEYLSGQGIKFKQQNNRNGEQYFISSIFLLALNKTSFYTQVIFLSTDTSLFINNQKFKQSPGKSLICQTISKKIAGANKRRKLNHPLREEAKTFFLHSKPKINTHFWTCQFKSVNYVYSRRPCNKLWSRSECLNI